MTLHSMRRVTRVSVAALCMALLLPTFPARAMIRLVRTLAGPSTAAFYPSGGEWDSSRDRIVVADTGLNRILFYELDGDPAGGFGRYTASPGPKYGFDTPRDVAVDPSGNIYVAVAAHNAIKAYTPNGVWLWTFNAGVFTPIGVSWDEANARLLVASTGNDRVIQLDAFGAEVDRDVSVDGLRDVDRGPDGLLYVADYKTHTIRAYDDSSDVWVEEASYGGAPTLSFPYNVVWHGDTMYVASTGQSVVKAWDGSSWSTIGVRCPLGESCWTPDERLDGLRRVAVTPEGDVIAFDFWGGAINVYLAGGGVVQIEGEEVAGPGFAHASGIDVWRTEAGNVQIFAMDRLNQRIERYASNGTLTAEAGDRGNESQPGAFSWPEGVAVGPDGVYVADTRNGRVTRWTHNLTDPVIVASGSGDSEYADLELHDGVLYVADRTREEIVTVPIGGGTPQMCLSLGPSDHPEGVALNSDGAIYVTFQNRIVRYPGCGQAASGSQNVPAIGVEVRPGDGAVFVTTRSDRVLRLRPNLAGVLDGYSGDLNDPHTLTVLGKRLWVADTYNNRVIELAIS